MSKLKLPINQKKKAKVVQKPTPDLLIATAIHKGDNLRRLHEQLGGDVMGSEGRKAVDLLLLMDRGNADAAMYARRIVYNVMGGVPVPVALHHKLMEQIIYDLNSERESYRFEEFFDNVLGWMMDADNDVDPSVIIATVMSVERIATPEKKTAIMQSKRYLDYRDKYRRIIKIIE